MDDSEKGIVVNPEEMLSQREREKSNEEEPSQVEKTLMSIKFALDAERGGKPTIYDLLAISNAASRDAQERGENGKGEKRLHETVVEMAAHEEPGDKKEAHVEAYLAEQIAHWKALRDDPDAASRREQYQSYVAILSSLRSEFFDDSDVAAVEEWANAMHVDQDHGEVVPAPPERFPEYVFQANRTAEVLEELRAKEDPDIDDLERYVVASKKDLEEQEEGFDEKNPGLRTAIAAATDFAMEHEDEIKDDRLLLVALPPDGEPQVSWNGKQGNEPGTKYYFFDPNEGPKDSYRLAWHITEQRQYSARIERAEKVDELLEHLKGPEGKSPAENIFAIQQIIATHMAHIEELESGDMEEKKKDMETLHAFASLAASKILEEVDEEEDDEYEDDEVDEEYADDKALITA